MNAPDKTVEVSQAARDAAGCPFCGAPGKLIHTLGHWQGTDGGARPAYGPAGSRIVCTKDDCSGLGWVFYGDDQDARAIEQWNTRATQPEAALREAVEEAKAALDGIYHYTFDNGLSEGDLRRLVRTEASDAAAVIDAALKDHRHG